MTFSAVDLAWVRSQIGSFEPPTDNDLEDAWDRLGDRVSIVREVLLGRRADFLARPASLRTSDYGEDTSANIRALDAQLAALDEADGVGINVVTTARLIRSDRCR